RGDGPENISHFCSDDLICGVCLRAEFCFKFCFRALKFGAAFMRNFISVRSARYGEILNLEL
uniref:hypothetical protein n=1 Tax=uncultured Campylobacter sp. TaxID=218934 RepID=UPI002624DCAD